MLVKGDDRRLRIVRSGKLCQFSDPVSKLCVVYPTRKENHPACMSVAEAIHTHMLPPDCPYVADIEGYRCAVDDYEPLEGKNNDRTE